MANYCLRCGIPLAIGNETDYCNLHGGPPLAPDATIRCPFCSEIIFASAKKCKHCGEFIAGELRQLRTREATIAPPVNFASPGTMKFKNPANGHVETAHSAGLWTLLFGSLYFAVKGVWTHAFISFILALCTFGISWLIYPFYGTQIVRTSYLRRGWIEIP